MELTQHKEIPSEKRQELLSSAQEYIKKWFNEHFSPVYGYHNWSHTIEVTERAILISRKVGLSDQCQWELTLAGLFHDSGYSIDYENHEEESARICRTFLEENQVDEYFIDRITRLILVTKPLSEPVFLEEKIIKDADLANVGSPLYFEQSDALRKEWETLLNKHYTDEEWYSLNKKFIKEHHFYTAEAVQLYHEQKEINAKEVKKRLKKIREDEDIEGNLYKAIKDSRSAQLIFKTTLRNQIDLTNIADNKANIMLSINAIIITISLPLLATNMRSNVYMIIPASVLLTTCVVTIITATLVTRPIKMNGITDLKNIKQGNTNLFFFGNFYKMNYKDYVQGLREVISKDEYIDQSMFKDLYNLGKTLGSKYRQLRTCYTIFMTGVIASVLAFGITYYLKLI